MKIISWLTEMVEEARSEGVVFGLSGGIDSAVVAALCKRAFGQNALGIIMPCYSDPQDEIDAKKLASSLEMNFKVVNLDKTFDEIIQASGNTDDKMAMANIKPRLRMTALYYHAAINNYLVVGSENKSEWHTGYFTKHGDSGVDLLPLANMVKTQVRMLAKHLDILESIIYKTPSAGLWEGQTDEAEMGFTYDDLDSYIQSKKIPSVNLRKKIDRLHLLSEHKRRMPEMFSY